MKEIRFEDSLFLSAQSEEIFGLSQPLFGKVVTVHSDKIEGNILYLSPQEASHTPSLRHVSAVICVIQDPRLEALKLQQRVPIVVVKEQLVFSQGDVISVSLRGRIHRHFRARSSNNAFLVTEVCNNLCIMCPQPPKPELKGNHAEIEQRIMQTLELMDDENLPDSLCITGGEPTMLKEGLIRIVEGITARAPKSLVHLLTNGRYLCHEPYTARLALASKQQLLVGIPLFGHVSDIHDYVVQSEGAFNQTLAGLLNCYRQGISIELRVVLHKVTVKYLKELAEFISCNLFFIKHVALMGMENMGFAKLNRNELMIDPWDYKDELSAAIEIFRLYGIDVRVFNLPLCVVNADTQPYCAQSISDFKTSWNSECEPCARQKACCGFFSSSTEKFWLSRHIQPFTER